ncbi:hypothetical protein Tco_0733717 [Tanacetum coccineum]
MPYPRFTKVIINYFISKDKTISMRNMINLHIIRDDSLLGTLKFVSKTQDCHQYGALIPDDMINQDIKDSNAYKTYYDFATGKVPPKKARKYKKVASPPRKLSLEAAQLKEATKRSKKDFHISQASGSGDGTNLELGVPDEQQCKTFGKDEGTDDNDEDSDDKSKGDDDKVDSDDDGNSDADDNERTDSDDDDENPSFTLKDYDEEEHDKEYESDDDLPICVAFV